MYSAYMWSNTVHFLKRATIAICFLFLFCCVCFWIFCLLTFKQHDGRNDDIVFGFVQRRIKQRGRSGESLPPLLPPVTKEESRSQS